MVITVQGLAVLIYENKYLQLNVKYPNEIAYKII